MMLLIIAGVLLWGIGLFCKIADLRKKFKEIQYWYQMNEPAADWNMLNAFEQTAEQLQLKRIPFLFVNPAVQIPFLKGIRYPAVVFPKKRFSAQEQQAAFAHELMHYKHHDLWVRYFFQGIFILYWFIPLEAVWEEELIEVQESLCDIAVCRQYQDYFSAPLYFQLIVEIAGNVRKCYETPKQLISKLLDSAGQLERRIGNMANYRKRVPGRAWKSMLRAGSAVGILLALWSGLFFLNLFIGENDQIHYHAASYSDYHGNTEFGSAAKFDAETEEISEHLSDLEAEGISEHLSDLEAEEISGHLSDLEAEEISGHLSDSEAEGASRQDSSSDSERFIWESLTQYQLNPGERLCSESFRGKEGEMFICMLVASHADYEIGIYSNGQKIILPESKENACINLELSDADYRVYIQNQKKEELKLEMFCAR